MKKELIIPIYLKGGRAVCGRKNSEPYRSGDPVELAVSCDNAGADAILLFDLSEGDAEHEQSIGEIRKIARATDIPVYAGGNVRRVEDIKKLIYAGCRKTFLNFSKAGNVDLAREVSQRFGKERILACVGTAGELAAAEKLDGVIDGAVLLDPALADGVSAGCGSAGCGSKEKEFETLLCVCEDEKKQDEAETLLSLDSVSGVVSQTFADPDHPVMELKHALKRQGIPVNLFESSLSFDEFKTNGDGLLPVVVQDYKTQEVLMVAYMNREAFETTVATGRMTYFSRSRQELWVKGLTSGHFQYVKELRIDCDNDTLLAKVAQVGAACHTGNRSCFYRTILKKEYDETNPLKVFEDVFAVIEDRKLHPKEGSYTNYLFEKGIDKILKKVGEEATEIVIAAKNPDPEEIKYEISDFLYHVMVLMAEKGVTWEDITEELARR